MISDDVKSKVIQLRQDGLTYDQIVNETGVAKGSVSSIIKAAGLSAPAPIEITDELLDKIQQRYNEIGNIKTVAKEFHISYARLSKIERLQRTKTKSDYDSVKDNRHRKKEVLVEYKGGKCQICGYDRCIQALDFHHLNPDEKDFSLSSSSKSLDELKKEADKCILVCSNCHRDDRIRSLTANSTTICTILHG